MPWRIRCGGLAALAGYGISQASSPAPAFRIRRICLPSGENFTLGALKMDRDANGVGSYGFGAAPGGDGPNVDHAIRAAEERSHGRAIPGDRACRDQL